MDSLVILDIPPPDPPGMGPEPPRDGASVGTDAS